MKSTGPNGRQEKLHPIGFVGFIGLVELLGFGISDIYDM